MADPSAKQPSDWDEDEDGEWEAPLVPNPKCAKVSGCGEWKRPEIDNPAYKGKWSAPFIDNPAYIGEWAPKQIKNKDYEEGVQLAAYDSMYIGYELWIVNNGTIFDNILVTDDIEYAKAQGEKLWRPTSKGEKDVKEKWDKENKPADEMGEDDEEGEGDDDEEEEEKDEL